MDDSNTLTEQQLLIIQRTVGDDSEVARLQQIRNAITSIRAKRYERDHTDDVVKEYSRLKGSLISTPNEAQ